MGYTKYVQYEHVCNTPSLTAGDSMYAPGSLWECDYCGREHIKVGPYRYRPTVSVVSK